MGGRAGEEAVSNVRVNLQHFRRCPPNTNQTKIMADAKEAAAEKIFG